MIHGDIRRTAPGEPIAAIRKKQSAILISFRPKIRPRSVGTRHLSEFGAALPVFSVEGQIDPAHIYV
jgi:hypothetical protein